MQPRFFLLFALCLFFPASVFAETASDASRLSLTLTPPLFQVEISPSTEWKTTLRVVNSNPFPITVYARAVNFKVDGETGNASVSPFSRTIDKGPHTLAAWVTLPDGPIVVARDTSYEIPVMIKVPQDAEPGGHYAAILVGTDPGKDTSHGSGTSVGSLISSLLFVRVPGDVVESGSIRDFYAEDGYVSKPETTFVVRFENNGNVHLVPQGIITISNMWGKERGKIDINDQNTFGNVLPASTRKFTFSWSGEESIFEAGRYKAIATLTYGQDGRKSVYREAYFWVIPWKPLLAILLGILAFVGIMIFAVRKYVERMLELERRYLGLSKDEFELLKRNVEKQDFSRKSGLEHTMSRSTLRAITAPIQEEIKIVKSTSEKDRRSTLSIFARRNMFAILTICMFIFGVVCIAWYFVEVFRAERTFHVEVRKEGGQVNFVQ